MLRLLAPALLLALGICHSGYSQQLAFPTAEGFGRFATGGRGGTVYHVVNLNDAGPGSFRDAVSQPRRTVVFDVGGVIKLKSPVNVASDLYLAGQTAPGDGITVYGDAVSFTNANQTIVRYLRFRMGHGGSKGKDAVTIGDGHDLIFDHVSISWGQDENFSVTNSAANVTLQNSIVAQGLHPHSAGGLIQSTGGTSILRNLYIDNHTRNIKVKGVNQFVNNVVYNWEAGAYILGDSERKSRANVTGNYFINGPGKAVRPFTRGNLNFSLFAQGNFQDSTRNGRLDGAEIPATRYGIVSWATAPFDFPAVPSMPAGQAYTQVLQHAGASLHRDAVDARLVQELLSLGRLGQIISDENTLPMQGPGVVKGGKAPLDQDRDGMPDAWERHHHFNILNPADGLLDADQDGYSNLEEYLQELVREGDGPVKAVPKAGS
ncbi:pectate lyase [Hymenobacter sp. BT175]|uniref:pectate lyase family protein n=1 Tax=Hymenobacter translucens TaxID=2886507 RepID=UPI001D0F3B02|nr:right-handed parallel beta-helix repeat-containing protein [Hymenobacter translucens]MCC2547483.1 pectate lyase [Hymenobacter translucens]